MNLVETLVNPAAMGMGDPFVEGLKALCEREGGYVSVAEKAHVSADNLWQILSGTKLPSGNPRGVGPKLRAKLSAAYPDWLSGLAPAVEVPSEYRFGELYGQGLPVVGTAKLGDDGLFYELEHPVGHGDGRIDWPSRDPNAYAVRCKGDSMKPRIRHGEFVIVEPHHAIASGDEVLVKAKDGRVMVKELVYRRDGMVVLDSVNESHPKISLAEEDIEVLHYVAGIAKSALWRSEEPQVQEVVAPTKAGKPITLEDLELKPRPAAKPPARKRA